MTRRVAAAAIVALVAVACSGDGPDPVSADDPTPTASATAVGTAEPASSPELPGRSATVIDVADGDTITVRLDGRDQVVRYIGVDSPERGECFYDEARDRNVQLVGGETVRLVKDVREVDRFDRLLRYVYVGDTFVNARLVREGYAKVTIFNPDDRHEDTLDALQKQARADQLGLWHPDTC